ncbi:hypothetical protein [Sandaracinus amylolyticus]|uniref:Uncharacterized protein n=1 Tax=Sandaracinus amylolyticus TaxID=927083 RepID=A0A0F6W3Z9_9BACT|nr:hypothetical protein [Sandaracinus amylolyticus]AKF06823.1 hypothetical protein DB32_003972 [Sandaracinus amylolyticus]
MKRVIAIAVMLLGCGAQPRIEAPTTPSATRDAELAGPAWSRDPDALAVRARALSARLEPYDATPSTALEARFFLAARGSRALELELPAGACAVLATFASSGMRDLDARLYTPEGALITEDVAPDPHPAIVFCATESTPSRAWLVLDAYDGSGAVLVSSLAIPSDALHVVARELGGTPGVARDGEARGELEIALLRRGLDITAAPLEVTLARDQRVRVPLRARAGRCFAVIATPRAPLASVAMRLLDLAGRPLADADASQNVLQRCETEDVERAIELWSGDAEGVVSITIAEGDDERLGGAAGLWLGAVPRDVIAASAGRRVARGTLARGEVAAHRVRVPRGCVDVVARPETGSIARLALEVHDVSRDESRTPSVERCGDPATLDVTITALGGAGDYAIEIRPRE